MTTKLPQPRGLPHRYEALDSLRGVCACMVLLFHIHGQGLIANLAPVRGSWMFVDFFFVLSGFVIYASYGDRLKAGFPIGRYILLRGGRIYPLHFAVLIAYVSMEVVASMVPGLVARGAFSGPKSVESLVYNLLFLQIFGLNGLSWNTPAWSIAAEFWTYLMTAFIFAYARRFFWPLVALMIAGSLAWLSSTSTYLSHTWDWSIFRCFYGFGLGMVGYELHRKYGSAGWVRSKWAATIAEWLAIAAALLIVSIATGSVLTLLAPPIFLAVILIFAKEQGSASRVLTTAPMRLLGLLSYSIYMTHIFVLGRLLEALQMVGGKFGLALVETPAIGSKVLLLPSPYADLFALIYLLATIGVSWVTYRLIELPARNWSRRQFVAKLQPA